jgi:hypothetical protein
MKQSTVVMEHNFRRNIQTPDPDAVAVIVVIGVQPQLTVFKCSRVF